MGPWAKKSRWKASWASWDRLENFACALEASWRRLVGLLEASWRHLGRISGASWVLLEASWSVLEASGGVLGASWVRLGASWGLPGASWSRPGPSWGRPASHFGVIFSIIFRPRFRSRFGGRSRPIFEPFLEPSWDQKTTKNMGGLFKIKVSGSPRPTPIRDCFLMHFGSILTPKTVQNRPPGGSSDVLGAS